MEKIRDYRIVYVEKKDAPILPRVFFGIVSLYILGIVYAISQSVN